MNPNPSFKDVARRCFFDRSRFTHVLSSLMHLSRRLRSQRKAPVWQIWSKDYRPLNLMRHRSHSGVPPKRSTSVSIRTRTLPGTWEPGGRTMWMPNSGCG